MVRSLSIADLWTAAGVLLGFQLAALLWRLNRELYMREKRCPERTWIPDSDIVMAASMLIIVVGVFILPILDFISVQNAARLLGLSAIFLAGYPFALAGHYNLYRDVKGPRDRRTGQELIALIGVGAAAVFYVVVWIIRS